MSLILYADTEDKSCKYVQDELRKIGVFIHVDDNEYNQKTISGKTLNCKLFFHRSRDFFLAQKILSVKEDESCFLKKIQ
jgi:hypothetical protein